MSDMDSFEQMIVSALQQREEHEPRLDVAAEAIARAQTQQERLARLARISWWTRASSAAAVILIVVTAGIGYWLWPASTSLTTTTDTTTVSTAVSFDMTIVGVGAFVVTVVALVLLTVMTPERPTLRLSPG